MRRVVTGLRNVHNARSPDDVALSPLGSRIPLVSLIHALAVAEHLNFRHAASALGVSQSSVSTRIKQLEQDLGTLLFERRHRGVRLTEAGQHFLEHVATGIEHLDHAVRTAGAIARGEQGRLRVGLYSSIAAGFLAKLLSLFREQYPAVDLQITEAFGVLPKRRCFGKAHIRADAPYGILKRNSFVREIDRDSSGLRNSKRGVQESAGRQRRRLQGSANGGNA